ncbi:hypothetical protein [uncultured Erythrobacter sp.]|uniref:alpha/beta hydrolase family protein n=1 Tax=uncultured Erythrobacter sp. TaxID=263913 RepID=UPI00260C431B|nr:hypothetical protein [uncultured Erythrobacter sp.]
MSDKAIQESGAKKALSRRQFGAITGAVAVAAGTPGIAQAANSTASAQLKEKTVSVARASGAVNGYFIHPSKGANPAVLSWRDGGALAESSRNAARRLAKQGYAVLVLDRDSGDAGAIEGDADAAVKWLEAQPHIDEKRIGTPEWAEQRIENGARN